MFPRKHSASAQTKILRALKNENKSYMQLKMETNLSDPVLSDHLKRLQKRKSIVKDLDLQETMP